MVWNFLFVCWLILFAGAVALSIHKRKLARRIKLSQDIAELSRGIADQHDRWPLVDEDYIPERRPDVFKGGGR